MPTITRARGDWRDLAENALRQAAVNNSEEVILGVTEAAREAADAGVGKVDRASLGELLGMFEAADHFDGGPEMKKLVQAIVSSMGRDNAIIRHICFALLGAARELNGGEAALCSYAALDLASAFRSDFQESLEAFKLEASDSFPESKFPALSRRFNSNLLAMARGIDNPKEVSVVEIR